jgi:hypothetical protein
MANPISCPTCGNHEMHPRKHQLLIRAYKVYSNGQDWSQCLVCSGYYDKDTLNETPNSHDEKKGWFA